jgi:hypothetical protein
VSGWAVRRVRLVGRGWLVHTRHLSASGFFVLMSSVQPIVFATLACYLFRAGDRPDALLYAAIGAGMLSIWSTTLVGSGQALTLLRAAGMLELLVAAPVPFAFVLAPITLATASVGLYSLVATLAWGWLLFDIPVRPEHPGLLLLAVPVTVFGLGMLGMVPVRQRADEPVRLSGVAAVRHARPGRTAAGVAAAAVVAAAVDLGRARHPGERGRRRAAARDRGVPGARIGLPWARPGHGAPVRAAGPPTRVPGALVTSVLS